MQKADLQPTSGKAPSHAAVDETVIRINNQQYWLYAAADPDTNELLYLRLFSTTTTGGGHRKVNTPVNRLFALVALSKEPSLVLNIVFNEDSFRWNSQPAGWAHAEFGRRV